MAFDGIMKRLAYTCIKESGRINKLDYRITEIHPKDGIFKDVHKTILNRPCAILSIKEGCRGWLLVDVGDSSFGPHRISISPVFHISGQDGNPEIKIETENTFYCLKSIPRVDII